MSNDAYYRDERIAMAYDAENGPDRDITRDDIPFYVALARKAARGDRPVLELGCGTGRVTLPMAEAGAAVTGLDSSAQMLAIARAKAEAAGVDIEWVEADMAGFRLHRRFGLAVIPFRSFQLLPTTEAQTRCFALIRQHLEPDGRLAFNIFNPDILSALAESTYASDDKRRSIERGDDGAVFTHTAHNLRVRWIFRAEMELLLQAAGFAIESLYGWFDGSAFNQDSTEMIWVARRS